MLPELFQVVSRVTLNDPMEIVPAVTPEVVVIEPLPLMVEFPDHEKPLVTETAPFAVRVPPLKVSVPMLAVPVLKTLVPWLIVTVVRPAPVMVPDAPSVMVLFSLKLMAAELMTKLPAVAITVILPVVPASIFVTVTLPVFAVMVWSTLPVLETSVIVRSVPSVVMLKVCAALKLARV